jgi:hypothetical protein
MVRTATIELDQYRVLYESVPGPVRMSLPTPADAESGLMYRAPRWLWPVVLVAILFVVWRAI